MLPDEKLIYCTAERICGEIDACVAAFRDTYSPDLVLSLLADALAELRPDQASGLLGHSAKAAGALAAARKLGLVD